MDVFEYIQKYVNVKLGVSNIHGVGVFAIRNIEENEKLFVEWNDESGEYTISNEELNLLDEEIKNHLFDMYGYKDIDGKFQMFVNLNKDCHWIFKTPLHWVNSCGFNEFPNLDSETLLTTKKIKKGEEILIKYGKYNKFKRIRTI